MQGYSWESVEVSLDKNQTRLTAKGENARKMERNRNVVKNRDEKTVEQQDKAVEQEEKTSTELTVPSKWDKFKTWFKTCDFILF